MSATHETTTDRSDYVTKRTFFILASVAVFFGVLWMMIGEEVSKMLIGTITYIFFLGTGINMEMSARKLADPHH